MPSVPSLRSSGGRRPWLIGVLALAVVLAVAIPVLAHLTGTTFEAGDGNLTVQGGETDWATPALANFNSMNDLPTGSGDDSFGQGSKEDTAVPKVVDGSIPNNKSDLSRFYTASEHVATPAPDGSEMFYFAWERVQDPSGTTNMDIELNQSDTLSSNGVTPVRTAGDVLFKFDLAQGGTHPVLGYHLWTGSAWDQPAHSLGGNFEASINTGAITDPIAGVPLTARTFGEAAINLTGAGLVTPGGCNGFASAYIKSRSSDSFSAALKDFVAPQGISLNPCGDVSVTKSTSDDSSPAGAVFTLYTGAVVDVTKIVGTCTTIADGTCPVTTGAFSNIPAGQYTIDETTVPPTYTKDSSLPETFTLAAGGSQALSYENVRVPGSVEITKVDDAGVPVDNAVFKIYSPAGITAGVPTGAEVGTCTTLNGLSCTIANVLPGTYTIDETTVPTGFAKDSTLPKSITVTSGAATQVSVTDPRKFKMIVLVCKEATDKLYSANVTINNSVRPPSLTSAGAANAGLSTSDETALCQLTAGAKGALLRDSDNNGADTHVANVTIP